MSELKKDILNKIKSDEIKMRSKNFFLLAKAVLEIGLIALFLFVIFIFNLSFYLPRRNMMMGRGMFWQNIPWAYVLLGFLGLGLFFWLIYRYTGAYKKHFLWIVGLISVVILAGAYLVSMSNFNERLERHQRMRGIYEGQRNGQFRGPDNRGPHFFERN